MRIMKKYILPICENFEDALNIMKSSPNLTGQDFLGLVVMLEDLYRLFDVLNTYNGRIGGTANVQMSSMQPENFTLYFTSIYRGRGLYYPKNTLQTRCDKYLPDWDSFTQADWQALLPDAPNPEDLQQLIRAIQKRLAEDE